MKIHQLSPGDLSYNLRPTGFGRGAESLPGGVDRESTSHKRYTQDYRGVINVGFLGIEDFSDYWSFFSCKNSES